jgi:hypothetical protein
MKKKKRTSHYVESARGSEMMKENATIKKMGTFYADLLIFNLSDFGRDRQCWENWLKKAKSIGFETEIVTQKFYSGSLDVMFDRCRVPK